MNEETCERKNIYEEEHERVYREFEEKYGIFGEGLEKSNEKSDKSGERFRGVFYHVSLFEIMSKFKNSKKF